MESFSKLHEICLRIEHLESSGDWLARSLIHTDETASQTGSLIAVLAQDVRTRLLDLVTELEKELALKERERMI